jgi:hypothetical protein
MKIKYLMVVMVVLITPLFADASWWNPGTWFVPQPAAVIEATVSISPSPLPIETPIEKIVEIPVEKIVEKIVEKPVDRVVYKDKIVEKIVADQTIVAENTRLKALVAQLDAKLNISQSEANSCKVTLDSMKAHTVGAAITDTKCDGNKQKYIDLTDKKFANEKMRILELQGVKAQQGGTTAGVSAAISSVNKRYDEMAASLNIEIERAKREMDLYCK